MQAIGNEIRKTDGGKVILCTRDIEESQCHPPKKAFIISTKQSNALRVNRKLKRHDLRFELERETILYSVIPISAYYVPGTLLGLGDILVNKKQTNMEHTLLENNLSGREC